MGSTHKCPLCHRHWISEEGGRYLICPECQGKNHCNQCLSTDILELTIEKGETWFYCYTCKHAFSNYCPDIPVEEFCQHLEDDGFSKDAAKIRKGERASEYGE